MNEPTTSFVSGGTTAPAWLLFKVVLRLESAVNVSPAAAAAASGALLSAMAASAWK